MLGPQDAVLAAVTCLSVGLLFPLQAVIDEDRPKSLKLVDTLPPAELISILAFGHRESAADLLEIRITNAMTDRMDIQARQDPRELWTLYSALLTLDPQNSEAAYRGSVYLSSTADAPGRAIQLLAQSLGEEDPEHPLAEGERARAPLTPNHPRRWLLYHEWAAIYFLMFRQRTDDPERENHFTRRAGELWLKCAQQPNGPEWLTNVGRKFMNKGWSRRQALEHEIYLWNKQVESGAELQKDRATARLKEAQCALVGEALQERVDQLAKGGRPVQHLRELPLRAEVKDREHLSDMDPLGVGYYLDQGKVIAPAWYASKAKRSIGDLYEAFKQRFPDRVPTHADLKIKEPEHLRVTITAEGLEVVARIPPGR